jgi:hypothetical protein
VLPYVTSIMRSLREHGIDERKHNLTAQRLANRPGRPDRSTLIAYEEAVKAAGKAGERFEETLEELHRLDVYCLDSTSGLALIPFAKDNQLAWFIYDLFDADPLRFWRYHSDPLDTRRPIAEAPESPLRDGAIV